MQRHSDFDDADEGVDQNAETLSPAVRRLVKQYDLDVTAIRGSGPSGRIRVGDVMSLLGNRAGSSAAPRPPQNACGVLTTNEEDTPRAASLRRLTLTYDPERLDPAQVNVFLAQLAHLLEHWPEVSSSHQGATASSESS